MGIVQQIHCTCPAGAEGDLETGAPTILVSDLNAVQGLHDSDRRRQGYRGTDKQG